MSESWTIRELCQHVEASLADETAPSNGQVRAVPDERSVRYYTTLGLLDRPALRGRTALYGARHLAQLVAIKRLQSEGRTLAEIQRLLPVMDDAALERLSGVALEKKPRRGVARRDFWREPVLEDSEAAPTRVADAPRTEGVADDPRRRLPASQGDAPPAAHGSTVSPTPSFAYRLELTLAPGVDLAFAATRPATDADAAALLAAAAPLLNELVRRHLIAPLSAPEASNP